MWCSVGEAATRPATTQARPKTTILMDGQLQADLRSYLLRQVRPFVAPSDPAAWTAEAERVRQRVLDEVI
ncbi:MAG TPA: hypothetical protein VLM89_16895, partial [Phycisphaerae bacterium]|nr:hypothetical protein [Phycisphaerae bacterium]